jgi:hypothetical protein
MNDEKVLKELFKLIVEHQQEQAKILLEVINEQNTLLKKQNEDIEYLKKVCFRIDSNTINK